MLGSTEWLGGLRDRALLVTDELRQAVQTELSHVMQRVMANAFQHHGLGTGATNGSLPSMGSRDQLFEGTTHQTKLRKNHL